MNYMIYKYRMYVDGRSDPTPEEKAYYKALAKGRYPWRDTGEFVYARRRKTAKVFYREMRKINPINKIKAEKIVEPSVSVTDHQPDAAFARAWKGFAGIMGSINNAPDEVRHFAANEHGMAACGIQFTAWGPSIGKPQCQACLEAAVTKHPEMKVYL